MSEDTLAVRVTTITMNTFKYYNKNISVRLPWALAHGAGRRTSILEKRKENEVRGPKNRSMPFFVVLPSNLINAMPKWHFKKKYFFKKFFYIPGKKCFL